MAINFDSLPDELTSQLIPKGTYYATIKNPEMKQPKDPAKPEYLNMRLELRDATGAPVGSIFDMIFESDADALRYKLKRLIKALNLPIQGEFTLKDLCKMVPEKQMIVDVKIEEGKDGYSDKSVVDIFEGEVYYPMSAASDIFGTVPEVQATDAQDAPAHPGAESDVVY